MFIFFYFSLIQLQIDYTCILVVLKIFTPPYITTHYLKPLLRFTIMVHHFRDVQNIRICGYPRIKFVMDKK